MGVVRGGERPNAREGWGPRRFSARAAGGIVSRARAAPLAARGRREPQEGPHRRGA